MKPSKTAEYSVRLAELCGWLNNVPQEEVDGFLARLPVVREIFARVDKKELGMLKRFAAARVHAIRGGITTDLVINRAVADVATDISSINDIPGQEELMRRLTDSVQNVSISPASFQSHDL